MTSSLHTRFYRDSVNGKWMGVCAGIADYTGVDVSLVRIGMAALTIMSGGWVILAYFLAGMIAPKKPVELYASSREEQRFWQGVRQSPARTARDVRSRFREIDRRLADIELFYTSPNRQLAQEIERLK